MWCRGTPGRNEVPSANVESTQFAKKNRAQFYVGFLDFSLKFC